jgi:hypothetical protein
MSVCALTMGGKKNTNTKTVNGNPTRKLSPVCSLFFSSLEMSKRREAQACRHVNLHGGRIEQALPTFDDAIHKERLRVMALWSNTFRVPRVSMFARPNVPLVPDMKLRISFAA